MPLVHPTDEAKIGPELRVNLVVDYGVVEVPSLLAEGKVPLWPRAPNVAQIPSIPIRSP